jgi:hypothetical protein
LNLTQIKNTERKIVDCRCHMVAIRTARSPVQTIASRGAATETIRSGTRRFHQRWVDYPGRIWVERQNQGMSRQRAREHCT